jgi:outer membrane protein assembly factor BamB
MVVTGLLVVLGLACQAFAAETPAGQLPCEPLGEPVKIGALGVSLVTPHPAGYHISWFGYESSDKMGVLSVRTDNGETAWYDLMGYGKSHIQMALGSDGALYIYAGNPAHFLRLEVVDGKLTDLGIPASPASYWMGTSLAQGSDGTVYVGSYPRTYLVACDTRTGKVRSLGRISDDEKERYIISVAVSADNQVYCGIGLHHRELWWVDPATGTKKQLLPAEMTEAQGSPQVWTAADGQVYGASGTTKFRCTPQGIEVMAETPGRAAAEMRRAGDFVVSGLDDDGRLVMKNAASGEVRTVQTDHQPRLIGIYSVGCERKGVLYGGAVFPGLVYSCDMATGKLSNLGELCPGAIQIYDTISLPEGLFMASYMGCKLDVYNPDQPIEAGKNPRHITSSIAGQERPVQWELGPDGNLYFGTTPAKGRLGGALVRLNPKDLTLKMWSNLVPNLSLTYLTAVPETGELFCCASVGGGSSAIPVETKACVFLWDPATESIVWKGEALPGERTYGRAIRAKNGLVYGLGSGKYYVFDPVKRQVVTTGDLPVQRRRFPDLSDYPVGPKGLIYGIGDDALYALDPTDNTVRIVGHHPALEKAQGFLVTQDGTLYFGSGPTLWRCRIPQS